MDFYRDEWLPHLKGSIPKEATRNRISLYTIALEGWRRGLKLRFYNRSTKETPNEIIYSLESESRIHYFNESNGDKNSDKALEICNDKGLTYDYLKKANVPIPSGKRFDNRSEINEMIDFASGLSFPLVVKPTNASSGKGVITNIKDLNSLKDAIVYVREKLLYDNIIIQEHIEGKEVRIYVLNDQVIAATNRLPANIVGDGKSTIVKLIEEKNKFRKQIPHLYYRPIKIDSQLKDLLHRKGYNLDSVLKKGERLFLRKISNVSAGGDPVDVTDQLTVKQKKIAIEAVKAIPGLTHCGVDMMISDDNDSGVVLEINTSPGIGSHLFPIEGNARDIPKALIDYYFPETVNSNSRNSNVYFGLQPIFDSLYGGYLSELEIKPHPENKLTCKRIFIHTDLSLVDFYNKIKKLILKWDINGYVQKKDSNTLEVLIGHENVKNLEKFIKFLLDKKTYLKIKNFVEDEWNQPIKIGFELLDEFNNMSIIELENYYNQNHKEIRVLEREVIRLSKRVEQVKNSHSWKLTKPLRKVKNIFK